MRPNNPAHTLLGKGDDGRRFLTGDFGEVNSSAPPGAEPPHIQTTRVHRRCTEFPDAVRTHRYTGLCWGPPGVGKTLSARHYAGTDQWEQWQCVFTDDLGPVPERVLDARTAFFTPTVAATPRQLREVGDARRHRPGPCRS